jgi:hypothetical protein
VQTASGPSGAQLGEEDTDEEDTEIITAESAADGMDEGAELAGVQRLNVPQFLKFARRVAREHPVHWAAFVYYGA